MLTGPAASRLVCGQSAAPSAGGQRAHQSRVRAGLPQSAPSSLPALRAFIDPGFIARAKVPPQSPGTSMIRMALSARGHLPERCMLVSYSRLRWDWNEYPSSTP
jgi:hypothetical protein